MALLTASDFLGFSDTFAIPAGEDVLAVFKGSVDLELSTGITQRVFDSFCTALS